jgi:hypothetical protein
LLDGAGAQQSRRNAAAAGEFAGQVHARQLVGEKAFLRQQPAKGALRGTGQQAAYGLAQSGPGDVAHRGAGGQRQQRGGERAAQQAAAGKRLIHARHNPDDPETGENARGGDGLR